MHEKALLLIGFAAIIALAILFTTPMDKKFSPDPLNEFPERVLPEIPSNPGNVIDSFCRSTGCSGQICAEEDVMTTCEFREEYVCYQTARCERQSNGRCGWTETSELRQCLSRSGVTEI